MGTVTLDGTTIHYFDAGAGEPALLLLHAFPLQAAMWEDQIAAFSPGRRVIAPDLMGFGASDAPDDPERYTMDAYADDAAALLDHLGVGRAVVAGLSMGGYVALALLRRHPGRVAGLVLADTRAGSDTDEVVQRRVTQQAQVREQGTAELVEAQLGVLLGETTRREHPEVVERARGLMAPNPPAGVIGGLEAMKGRPDSTDLLAGIAVPTLVIVGEDDAPSPPAVAEGMHRAIPGSRLVVLPDVGHLTNLEAPEAFNEALGAILEEVGG